MSTSYSELLDLSKDLTFSLVWRDDLEFNEAAIEFVKSLDRYKIREARAKSWPGTTLESEGATIRFFTLCEESKKILMIVDTPFQLISPNFPEDLALYDCGDLIYASSSHEGLEWFY